MHQNRITEIKDLCRKEFASLEVLDLGTNKIQELPIALVHYMGNLNQLTLTNNDINKLPHLLGFHKTLKYL